MKVSERGQLFLQPGRTTESPHRRRINDHSTNSLKNFPSVPLRSTYPAIHVKQGFVECVFTMSPTPAPATYTMSPTPAPATPNPDSNPGNDGSNGGAPAPEVTFPPVTPGSPTTDRAMAPTLFRDEEDGDDSGLSTGEAVGIGVGASVVAIVGGVAISNWYKGS